jgi:hypothetical protein
MFGITDTPPFIEMVDNHDYKNFFEPEEKSLLMSLYSTRYPSTGIPPSSSGGSMRITTEVDERDLVMTDFGASGTPIGDTIRRS